MPDISLDTIDTINKKLSQADAISALIMANHESDTRFNSEIQICVVWAVADLINDVKTLIRNESESNSQSNRRGKQ